MLVTGYARPAIRGSKGKLLSLTMAARRDAR
jgi:hypothetical protein